MPDLNETNIAFWAGEDTTYTFSFNNENLSLQYQHLYMIDSVANKVIDVFASGTKYTFNVSPTSAPIKRFKLVTSLPIVTPTDTIVVQPAPIEPVDTIITVPSDTVATPVVPVIIPDSVVTTPTDPVNNNKDSKDKKDKKDKKNKCHDVKIYSVGKTIIVENNGKAIGKLKIYDSFTGRMVKNIDINKDGTTTIPTDLKPGVYVINGITSSDIIKKNVVIH